MAFLTSFELFYKHLGKHPKKKAEVDEANAINRVGK